MQSNDGYLTRFCYSSLDTVTMLLTYISGFLKRCMMLLLTVCICLGFSGLAVAEEPTLPLLDDFSVDSRGAYMTSLRTGQFLLPEKNWRLDDNKFFPAPVKRAEQWNQNPDTWRNGILYRKKERLKPGQAISVTVGYSKRAWKYERFGLAIEKHVVTVTPGETGYYVSAGKNQYDLKAKKLASDEITLTLTRGVKSEANTIHWTAVSQGIEFRGQLQLAKLPKDARFGVTFGHPFSQTMRSNYLSEFRYGNQSVASIPNYPIAELTLVSKFPKVESNRYRVTLENRSGALTKNELQSLTEWALNEPGQFGNHGNRALKHHTRLFRVFRVYAKTMDRRLLDHLVDCGRKALLSRNDFNKTAGRFKILNGRDDNGWTYDQRIPTWPHFMGWKDQDGEKIYFGDVGEDAVGMHYMALAARAIAITPNCWNKKVDFTDRTYREVARAFVKQSIYTFEKAVRPRYLEPETMEGIYQFWRYPEGSATLNRGGYIPFNRFWHLPVAFASLCPAMEILDIDTDKVATFDKITETSLKRWYASMQFYEKDGYPVLDYPYCYPSVSNFQNEPERFRFLKSNFKGFPSEDLGHLGIDIELLSVLHYSARYEIPAEILTRYANTLLVLKRDQDGYFPYRLNGSGAPRTNALPADAYFLIQFQKRLADKFWDNPKQDKNALEKEILFSKLFSED